ncbi:MAG: type II toxin-antitoxin system VapC family toxin [Acidimicrobiia bacterium]
MIVVDASVVVDLLLGPGSDAGDTLAEHLVQREVVCSPHLVDAEVGQTLRRFVLRGELSGSRAVSMVEDLVNVPIRRFPHTGLLGRAFELRSNVTVYDGLYLALAEALESPLLTGDAALADVPGCRAAVDVVVTST